MFPSFSHVPFFLTNTSPLSVFTYLSPSLPSVVGFTFPFNTSFPSRPACPAAPSRIVVVTSLPPGLWTVNVCVPFCPSVIVTVGVFPSAPFCPSSTNVVWGCPPTGVIVTNTPFLPFLTLLVAVIVGDCPLVPFLPSVIVANGWLGFSGCPGLAGFST